MRSEPIMSFPDGVWEARDQAPMTDPWWEVPEEGSSGLGPAVMDL